MPDLAPFATELTSALPETILQSIQAAETPSLTAGPQDASLAKAIEQSDANAWQSISDHGRGLAESGLWLLAGDLDRSHTISQSIESAEGSFWHGIMHRREGDYGNAKYWFRRVGAHPAFATIRIESNGIYESASAFVDTVQDTVASLKSSAANSSSTDSHADLCAAQWIEWQALMIQSMKA